MYAAIGWVYKHSTLARSMVLMISVEYGSRIDLDTIPINKKSSTGDHGKDQILLAKVAKYIGFCLYRRSYSKWSPAIDNTRTISIFDTCPIPNIRSICKTIYLLYMLETSTGEYGDTADASQAWIWFSEPFFPAGGGGV